MFIVEFENGTSLYWLTGGNIGDPPRTLIKSSAKKYKTQAALAAALTRAIKRNPSRQLEGRGKVVPA